MWAEEVIGELKEQKKPQFLAPITKEFGKLQNKL